MAQYEIEWVERDIIEKMDQGEKVYIESGAACDCIIGYSVRKYKTYSWQAYEEKEIIFMRGLRVFLWKKMLLVI